MARIDFTRIEVYADLTKQRTVAVDMRKTVANALYQQGAGLACHALAMKIWNGKGEQEFDADECSIITRLVEQGCTPAVIDAFHALVGERQE